AMSGPFATLQDYCDALEERARTQDVDTRRHCEGSGDDLRSADIHVEDAPLYREATVLSTIGLDQYWNVALHLEDGWWIDEQGFMRGLPRSQASIGSTLTSGRLISRGAGRTPLVEIRYRVAGVYAHDVNDVHDKRVSRWWDDEIVLCGVGAQGPFC